MMNGRISSVVALCLLCTVLGVRVSLVKLEDIEYWDIDSWTDMSDEEKVSTKANIVKQLNSDLEQFNDEIKTPAVPLTEVFCSCPRVFGPVVCDSKGESHSNTCIFACSKANDSELKPKKIFVDVHHDLEPKKLCKLNL